MNEIIKINKIIDIDINTQQTESSIKEFSGYVNFQEISSNLRYSSRTLNEDNDYYQRPTNTKRVNDIKSFLREHYKDKDQTKILPFPTPVTLSINSEIITDNSKVSEFLDTNNEFDPKKFFKETNESSIIINNCLYIDKDDQKNIFIVDGQHRISAIEEFIKESGENFYLYFTLLVNYDLSMQAKVFANINFKVKPVNKSLYYDIFGSIPNEFNEMTFSHMIASRINKDKDIGNLIKMLGNGSGTVSLAFIVETIIDTLIKYNSKNDIEPPQLNKIYNSYINDIEEFKKNYSKVGLFFIFYFKFIKNNFRTFPNKSVDDTYSSFTYKNILTKTTGIYSLIKILNKFDIEKLVKEYNEEELEKKFKETLMPIIEYEEDLFGNRSPHKGSGGKGKQNDLYLEILEILETGRLERVDRAKEG